MAWHGDLKRLKSQQGSDVLSFEMETRAHLRPAFTTIYPHNGHFLRMKGPVELWVAMCVQKG